MRVKRAGKIWNWTVASKHAIIECERSQPENLSNWTVASEASGKFFENFALFPPNSSKLRSDYLFSFQKRTNYLFPAFSRSGYLFPKSARPPSESNSRPLRFARCCTSVLDFHSKNLQITSKLLTQGYRYHKIRKRFWMFFRSYSELLSKFGDISFQKYLSKGISHPVFYGDLVYKLRRVKETPNFSSSGSQIVKRLRRRQYDPVIIVRTIGLELGPFTVLYRPFLKHRTLTNKVVGTIWRALSKPP